MDKGGRVDSEVEISLHRKEKSEMLEIEKLSDDVLVIVRASPGSGSHECQGGRPLSHPYFERTHRERERQFLFRWRLQTQ